MAACCCIIPYLVFLLIKLRVLHFRSCPATALQEILSKIDTHIQTELTDVQNLKDGKYHQADSMYKRYLSYSSSLSWYFEILPHF